MNTISQKITIRSGLAITLALALLLGVNIPVFAASGKTLPPPPPPPPPVTTTTTVISLPTGAAFPPTSLIEGSAPFIITWALVNTGTIPLVINTIGPMSAPVTLNGAGPGLCTSGMTLPTGTALTVANPTTTGTNVCLIELTVDPATVGPILQTAPITFQNAVSSSVTVSLGVNSANPVLQVSGSSAVQPSAPLGTSAAATLFYFLNSGSQPLVINDIRFSGANPGDFVRGAYIQNCGRCGFGWADCKIYGDPITVPSFKECVLQFNFRPTVLGPSTATVTLTTNDPVTPVKILSLAGNGLPALIPPPPVSAFNVTDIWATPGENAWKLNIVHHQKIGTAGTDVVDATFDTFDVNDVPTWFTVKNGTWTSSNSYTGEVHQANGTFFNNLFSALDTADTIVGTATLSFIDANNGGFTYTINGVTVTKTIIRTAF